VTPDPVTTVTRNSSRTLVAVVALLVAADSYAETTSASDQAPSDPRGTVVLQATAAAAQIYLDEQFPDHWEFGGSVRFFLSSRLAVDSAFLKFQSNVSSLPNEHRYIWSEGILGLAISVEARAPVFWAGVHVGYRFSTRGQ
jgi:hypothetical protein